MGLLALCLLLSSLEALSSRVLASFGHFESMVGTEHVHRHADEDHPPAEHASEQAEHSHRHSHALDLVCLNIDLVGSVDGSPVVSRAMGEALFQLPNFIGAQPEGPTLLSVFRPPIIAV